MPWGLKDIAVQVWLQLFGLALKHGKRSRARGTVQGRNGRWVRPEMFSKAMALTTIDSVLGTLLRRDIDLLPWFPAITSSGRNTHSSSSVLMDCWGLGRKAGFWNTSWEQTLPLGAQLPVSGRRGSFMASKKILPD